MKNKITQESVQIFFNSLPKREILEYAKNIQSRIALGDETLLKNKDDRTIVTEADTYIERLIINCFNKSPLKELCGIYGEEKIGNFRKDSLWVLLIDPIDGTGSLAKGDKTWGVMIGLQDENGILKYSWNLLSTGEVFESNTAVNLIARKSLNNAEKPRIDFYDYSSSQKEVFRDMLFKAGLSNCELASCPSAIWAGWELYQNKLSALTWVAGKNEKKTYPSYDLIFLDVLMRQGYKIRLGKTDSNENSIVIVAPTDEDADMLYDIALHIVSGEERPLVIKIKNKVAL